MRKDRLVVAIIVLLLLLSAWVMSAPYSTLLDALVVDLLPPVIYLAFTALLLQWVWQPGSGTGWFQFSLRGLMVFLFVFSVGLGINLCWLISNPLVNVNGPYGLGTEAVYNVYRRLDVCHGFPFVARSTEFLPESMQVAVPIVNGKAEPFPSGITVADVLSPETLASSPQEERWYWKGIYKNLVFWVSFAMVASWILSVCFNLAPRFPAGQPVPPPEAQSRLSS